MLALWGNDSAIDKETTAIVLECAWFEPISTRLSARAHKLQTDSSYRFERGVDYNLQHRALERATALIKEICGGVVSNIIESVSEVDLPKREPILLRIARAESVLGIDLGKVDIDELPQTLRCK